MINAVAPGWVKSANDGDWHYIGFGQLCRLYGLDPRKTINADDPRAVHGYGESEVRVHFPRYDGNYPMFGGNGD